MKAKQNLRLWVGLAAAAIIIVPLLLMLGQRMEGTKPKVELDSSSLAIGVTHELSGRVSDDNSGIRKIWIGLYKDGKESVLLEKVYGGSVVWGQSETRQEVFKVTISPEKLGLTDGEALLRIVARDYSWRGWLNGNRTYIEKAVTVDTRPPQIEILTGAHNISPGGSGLVMYRLSENCPHNGVKVGDNFFPGHVAEGYPANVRLAFFALAYNQRPGSGIFVQASDSAGNLSKRGFRHYIKKKRYRRDVITISDGFLRSKTPEFSMMVPDSAGLPAVDTFLKVNREVRRQNSAQIIRVTGKTANKKLWEGRFLRLPKSAPRAQFAERRTYRYQGKDIDKQVHLGIDLASIQQSPVPAANSGKVAFAGSLGIYGNTIIIDHGLGLFSLYAHLSSFSRDQGQEVKQGDIIGRTGSSGMAGGDHLHFSMLVHNTFV
ncbi:MAG: M23 family metallopeptidase, partial [Desulfobacterales bacterium]|nr:M23 family metallopeptidase [Desulfobacterales bacterium]